MRCKRDGCKVKLPNKGSFSNRQRPYIVIDMDNCESLVPKEETHCDFLFIGECNAQDWVVPIELTTGDATTSKIVPQLRAGATIAKKIVSNKAKVKFRPVAAYDGGLKRAERDAFRKESNRVKFRKQNEAIRLIRCNARLEQALKPS